MDDWRRCSSWDEVAKALKDGYESLDIYVDNYTGFEPVETILKEEPIKRLKIEMRYDTPARFLQFTPNLMELSWTRISNRTVYLTIQEVKDVCSEIQKCTDLEILRLPYCSLFEPPNQEAQVANALAPIAEKCTKLKHLDLAGNHMQKRGANWFASVLKKFTNLERLDLRFNYLLSDDGIQHLAPAIKNLTNLKHLDLNNCD